MMLLWLPLSAFADAASVEPEEIVDAVAESEAAAAEEAAQRDSRIDVAATDTANRVSHRYDSQTESERRSHHSRNIVHRITTQTDGNAAAHQYKHHRAHHFC